MGKDLGQKYGLEYFSTSAKAAMGISEAMDNIIDKTIEYKFGDKNKANERKSIMLNRDGTSGGSNKRRTATGEDAKGRCC